MSNRLPSQVAEKVLDMESIIAAVESDDNLGFCTVCTQIAYGVEPDACEYTCENCGEAAVYGAEELLIRGGI